MTAEVGLTGRLRVGGADLVDLAEELGTPLFVYDEEHLRATCREAVGHGIERGRRGRALGRGRGARDRQLDESADRRGQVTQLGFPSPHRRVCVLVQAGESFRPHGDGPAPSTDGGFDHLGLALNRKIGNDPPSVVHDRGRNGRRRSLVRLAELLHEGRTVCPAC